MAETGRELADLAAELVTYPQVLVNVRVTREARTSRRVPAIAAAMARVEERLAGQGRLLVRYSGTEPLLRVMIEGRDQSEIQHWAAEIAGTVKEHSADGSRQAGCAGVVLFRTTGQPDDRTTG